MVVVVVVTGVVHPSRLFAASASREKVGSGAAQGREGSGEEEAVGSKKSISDKACAAAGGRAGERRSGEGDAGVVEAVRGGGWMPTWLSPDTDTTTEIDFSCSPSSIVLLSSSAVALVSIGTVVVVVVVVSALFFSTDKKGSRTASASSTTTREGTDDDDGAERGEGVPPTRPASWIRAGRSGREAHRDDGQVVDVRSTAPLRFPSGTPSSASTASVRVTSPSSSSFFFFFVVVVVVSVRGWSRLFR